MEKTLTTRPLKTKILLSQITVIVVLSTSIASVGAYLIKKDIIDKAQTKVSHDLNVAREVYKQEVGNIENIIRLSAQRFCIKNALMIGNMESVKGEMETIRKTESLDILTLTDHKGKVVVRSRNSVTVGDSQTSDKLVSLALSKEKFVSATEIISKEELLKESMELVNQAHIVFVPTPKAKPTHENNQASAMCIKAAAPVFDDDDNLIGVLYGGNLLNRNYRIVDTVKEIVYQGLKYKGKDAGNVTVFQKDLRISTNVMNLNGDRAIGTRVSEDVYNQVLLNGIPWIGRAFVVNDWYKTAYEPIRDIDNEIIGMLYVGTLEQPFRDISRNILLIFLLIIASATLLSMIFSAILTAHISKPLTSLLNATATLSEGQLGKKVDIQTGLTELNTLAESFNRMSATLNEREEHLKRLNKNYVDLISFVTHELRGILASAVMNAYAIRDGYLGLINFKQQKAIDSVTRNLDYLTAVVGKFLNLGRIEKGELNVHKSQINLSRDVFSVSIVSLLPLAQRKGMKVNNRLAPDLEIVADLDLMQIVANNLIGNAIKYGHENGNVTITNKDENGQIEIDVFNDSIPITTEQKERLFSRFSRLDNEATKKVKGTGLGLYITKQIIEKHGGDIRIEPREKGNSFIFTIEKD